MGNIRCAGEIVGALPLNADVIRLAFRQDVRPFFSLLAMVVADLCVGHG